MRAVLTPLVVLLSLALFSTKAVAQCDAEVYSQKALKALQQGYTFVKSYKIDGKNGARKNIEYTCVFSKDTNYMLRIEGKDGGAKGIVATLLDNQRQELTTNNLNGKSYPGWTYRCRSTGIYYILFSFKDSESYCGAAVLGFKR
ncbi:MAG: hypothetical protein RMJ44_00360 [Cytophagales bacterium]|nr:hypothetical protein [Bernardetiaceae bacterium]MDW8209511.1 hypothetical protein [Cytophagales bacterium]